MPAPKLVHARPNGQSAVRVVFDVPMRELPPPSTESPTNASLWISGGGLPAVTAVTRLSATEYELALASPAPLAAGYTVTVASSVQGADGTPIDPAFRQLTFNVTVPDLRLTAVTWTSTVQLDLTFSEALATIEFDVFADVVTLEPVSRGSRPALVAGISQSGSTFRLTLEAPGTAGAVYTLQLNREVFQSLATSTVLKLGDDTQSVLGQGAFPTVAGLVITETTATATSSEVLGFEDAGWPLRLGLYETSVLTGTGPANLGNTVALGTTPDTVRFSTASYHLGDTVSWSVRQINRTVASGSSFVAAASSVVGAGTELLNPGVTTLNKISGPPFELVFAGGSDSIVLAGRRVSTTLAVSFLPSALSYPLLALTFLNTQLSLVLSKTAANFGVLQLYRGQNPVGFVSAPFAITAPFALTVIDAAAEGGFVSVMVNGVVVAGAPAAEVTDSLLQDMTQGATAVALTLGSPAAPSAAFSVMFSASLSVLSYVSTGLLGTESQDLLNLLAAGSIATVTAGVAPPSPGVAGTGTGAFGAYGLYRPDVDAVEVVIGFNKAVLGSAFTGSVTLTTLHNQPLDQVLVDDSYLVTDEDPTVDPEIVVVFLHPKQCLGLLAVVTLDIGGVTYSSTTPVTALGSPPISVDLTQQPANWYHPRLVNNIASTGVDSFGPSAVTATP